MSGEQNSMQSPTVFAPYNNTQSAVHRPRLFLAFESAKLSEKLKVSITSQQIKMLKTLKRCLES